MDLDGFIYGEITMYTGSAAFQTANEKPFQKHRLRGFIDNIAFSSANILAGSLTFSNACSAAPDSKVAAVNIGKLTVTFMNNLAVTPMTWNGRVITLIFGLCIDEEQNTFEEFPVGSFIVSEASINADGVSVVAYDEMSLFDKKLPDSYLVGGLPYDIATAVCRVCNASFGMSSLQVAALPKGTQNF